MFKDIKYLLKEYGPLIKEHFYETILPIFKYIKSKIIGIVIVCLMVILSIYVEKQNEISYINYDSFNVFDFIPVNSAFIVITIFVIIFIVLIIPILDEYIDKASKTLKNIYRIIRVILVGIYTIPIIAMFLGTVGKQVIYYANSFIETTTENQVFVIDNYKDGYLVLRDEKSRKIRNTESIKYIDSIRKTKNQKSIYHLEDQDTILVTFKKGFLDELYLK